MTSANFAQSRPTGIVGTNPTADIRERAAPSRWPAADIRDKGGALGGRHTRKGVVIFVAAVGMRDKGCANLAPSLHRKGGATQTGDQRRNKRRQSAKQTANNTIILESDNQPTAVKFLHSLQARLPFLRANERMQMYPFRSKEDDMELLKGKTAIVTGGTRGIGFAIVKAFLDNGAKVALCGSREGTASAAVEKLKAINPDYEVMGIWPDMTDPDSIAAEFAKVNEAFGRIDILGNNAGVSARESIYDYDPAAFDKTMALNVNAVFYCCKAVAPFMRAQGGGAIINTSSMVSIYGQPSGCAYPASKFAVNGLTKSLARELAADQIRVNAVAPGVTHTDMVDALPKEVIDPLIATIPLGRMGEPEDIANAYVFLASDMASYISGVVLSVDGLARS